MGTFLKSDFDKNLAKQLGYLSPAEEQDDFGVFIMHWGIIFVCSIIIAGCILSIMYSLK